MMPGVTFEEITDAITDAYEEDELKKILRTRMNLRLDVIIGPKPFGTVVFELLGWSERQGREIELVRVTSQARPAHVGMQRLYKKYGMAIPVYVQSAGAGVAGAPTDVTDTGLEKLVRPHLTFADFAVWRGRMTQVEGQVCRITLNGAARGTGFLVGPDTVLTNYHVLEPILSKHTSPSAILCQFDYKILANGDRTETPVALHATDWNIDSSPYSRAEADGKPDREAPTGDELDYALVRLADAVGAKPAVPNPRPGEAPPRGWVRVPDAAPAFAPQMAVIIAQHPDGQPLKLALDTQAIDQAAGLWLNQAGNRVRYATNTEGGSSGSPCFDFNWNLIALHHYGDPAYNHPSKYNQGIPIGKIRERLAQQNKAGALGGDSPLKST